MTKAAQLAQAANLMTAPLSHRNKIINGNFDFWGRGTSFSNPASGSYTAERWGIAFSGTAGTFTVSQQAWTPGINPYVESTYYLQWAQTVAGSGDTTRQIFHRIEGVRTCAGQNVSVSIVAWADSARSVPVFLQQNFGSSGSSALNFPVGTMSLTTTPTLFTFTCSVPSVAGKTISGGNDSLQLYFNLPINTTFTFNIGSVQVEAGLVATPFELRPLQIEQALCQRYFEVVSAGIQAYMTNGNAPNYVITFRVTKRATPQLTLSNIVYASSSSASATVATYSAMYFSAIATTSGVIGCTATVTVDAEL